MDFKFLLKFTSWFFFTKSIFSGYFPRMGKKLVLILVISISYCFGTLLAQSQQSSTEGPRKIVHKVEPKYPEVAKRMNLGGTVKVIAIVAADGDVKKVEAVGGSPILVEAAESAISQWKFAPGAESREPVELRFNP